GVEGQAISLDQAPGFHSAASCGVDLKKAGSLGRVADDLRPHERFLIAAQEQHVFSRAAEPFAPQSADVSVKRQDERTFPDAPSFVALPRGVMLAEDAGEATGGCDEDGAAVKRG